MLHIAPPTVAHKFGCVGTRYLNAAYAQYFSGGPTLSMKTAHQARVLDELMRLDSQKPLEMDTYGAQTGS